MHDILKLLLPLGYELFDVETAAAWRYSCLKNEKKMTGSRQRLIGLNLILIPSLFNLKKLERDRILARIKILCWYKFYDLAFLLADHIKDKKLKIEIEKLARRRSSFLYRLISKIRKTLYNYQDFPRIT